MTQEYAASNSTKYAVLRSIQVFFFFFFFFEDNDDDDDDDDGDDGDDVDEALDNTTAFRYSSHHCPLLKGPSLSPLATPLVTAALIRPRGTKLMTALNRSVPRVLLEGLVVSRDRRCMARRSSRPPRPVHARSGAWGRGRERGVREGERAKVGVRGDMTMMTMDKDCIEHVLYIKAYTVGKDINGRIIYNTCFQY